MTKQKEKPRYFQTQIVDNFFDRPQEIIKFANSLEYQIGPHGFWPGKRTEQLHINHKFFFDSFLSKLFALSFDYINTKLSWSNVGMYFQKTKAFDPEDKKNILNTGLIHQDEDFLLVGLVYLTYGADIDSGTSIMLPTKDYKNILELGEKKIALYKKSQGNLSKKDSKNYKKLIIDTNKNFEESIKFNNIFNRLITYTRTDFHRCNSFYTGKEERLTLVFFIKKIHTSVYTPLQRSKANLVKFSS
ncbi:DUF6445 family protein [Candidatus Pelagibacter sp.]|nr:DUF6445 family protein [Candidatus Pelagibacter sp.]